MIKKMFQKGLIFPVFIMFMVQGQHVSSYSIGKYGTPNYESFGFWIKDGKRSDISYSYGAISKTFRLQFAGIITKDQEHVFKVRFPNNLVLFVQNSGDDLLITDSVQHYRKIFKWEYEGPANGIGTFCVPCATDEKEAIGWLKQYYFR